MHVGANVNKYESYIIYKTPFSSRIYAVHPVTIAKRQTYYDMALLKRCTWIPIPMSVMVQGVFACMSFKCNFEALVTLSKISPANSVSFYAVTATYYIFVTWLTCFVFWTGCGSVNQAALELQQNVCVSHLPPCLVSCISLQCNSQLAMLKQPWPHYMSFKEEPGICLERLGNSSPRCSQPFALPWFMFDWALRPGSYIPLTTTQLEDQNRLGTYLAHHLSPPR